MTKKKVSRDNLNHPRSDVRPEGIQSTICSRSSHVIEKSTCHLPPVLCPLYFPTKEETRKVRIVECFTLNYPILSATESFFGNAFKVEVIFPHSSILLSRVTNGYKPLFSKLFTSFLTIPLSLSNLSLYFLQHNE